jgi:cytochrome c peroxidase
LQNSFSATRRNTQLDVLELRRAQSTLKPFLGVLMGWNGRAAQLREQAGSPYSDDEDRRLARLEAGALLAEVRRRHTEFQTAIKGEPEHSRISDVDAAFRRLIDQLRLVVNGNHQ